MCYFNFFSVTLPFLSNMRDLFFVILGVAMPVAPQPQFILPTHSPQFMQGSGSDQNAG